jgi:hypothetical protein
MFKIFKKNINKVSGNRIGTYDEYISFIRSHKVTSNRKDCIFDLECHHILPKSLCQEIDLPAHIQDDSDNKVLLFPTDHIKAHILLFKYLRSSKTAAAVKAVSNFIKLNKSILSITDEDVELIVKAKEIMMSTSSKIMSNCLKKLWKDSDWVARIKESHLNMSDEARLRISTGTKKVMSSQAMRDKMSRIQRGKKYYTNGIEVKRFFPDEIPIGWIKYHRKDYGASGKRRYTDGIHIKSYVEGEQPDGWVFFKFSDEQVKKLKEAHLNYSPEVRERFSKGRKGKKKYTDGNITKLFFEHEVPDGWIRAITSK